MNPLAAVFTPEDWADWALDRTGAFEVWQSGKSICDPTGGDGVFLRTLAQKIARKNGRLTEFDLKNLYYGEKEEAFAQTFLKRFREETGLDFPSENVRRWDLFENPDEHEFDLVVGNPPWANFVDLPESMKDSAKVQFLESGLVNAPKELLWGRSRIDVAALILERVLRRLLAGGGKCAMFLPLSLLLGEGAHEGFRRRLSELKVAVERVWDFDDLPIFPGISVRYGFVEFKKHAEPLFPIPYWVRENFQWVLCNARPAFGPTSSYSIWKDAQAPEVSPIEISARQVPRQGVNTCGANEVFQFHTPIRAGLYPLVTAKTLSDPDSDPEKWIYVPYSKDAKVFSWKEIQDQGWGEYLSEHREKLTLRKGTMIQNTIRRGSWWGLLGVGPYSFSPWKVVWRAYGGKSFEPVVVGSWNGLPWQANQAMQAFIPCWDEEDARRICHELKTSGIEAHLKAFRMAGTCNWAQPSRIKPFLKNRNATFPIEPSAP